MYDQEKASEMGISQQSDYEMEMDVMAEQWGILQKKSVCIVFDHTNRFTFITMFCVR